jgi:muramoyltetrapeptide carboxypeptidase LdcA involved in peptidoglycan recycling
MKKPKGLQMGDKVAVVSLSSGILGESFAEHQLKLGSERLTELGLVPVFMPHALKGMDALDKYPEWRAEDLKEAFRDPSVKGIICAIGGDDTYRLLPYLMEDDEFIENVQSSPKLFTGFSDTTVNHLLFHRLGMTSFYGPNFLNDFAELGSELLPYTKTILKGLFAGHELDGVPVSDTWYVERTDFSEGALGKDRKSHTEENGIEVLQGEGHVTGKLLGGCLESLVECLTGERYKEQADVIKTFNVFPSLDEWKNALLFIETSEERPTPDKFREMLNVLKKYGLFEVINGILVGKPQNEVHYEEYKSVLVEILQDKTIPILYNLPFGHAYPRCLLPYGIETTLDTEDKSVNFDESYFSD